MHGQQNIKTFKNVDILLTVYLSIFILIMNQLDALIFLQ